MHTSQARLLYTYDFAHQHHILSSDQKKALRDICISVVDKDSLDGLVQDQVGYRFSPSRSVVQASDRRCGSPLTKLIVRAKHPDQLLSISKHDDDFFWKEVRQGKREARG